MTKTRCRYDWKHNIWWMFNYADDDGCEWFINIDIFTARVLPYGPHELPRQSAYV